MSFLDRWSPWRLRRDITDLRRTLQAADNLIITLSQLLRAETAYQRDLDRERVELFESLDRFDYATTKYAEAGTKAVERFANGEYEPSFEPAEEDDEE